MEHARAERCLRVRSAGAVTARLRIRRSGDKACHYRYKNELGNSSQSKCSNTPQYRWAYLSFLQGSKIVWGSPCPVRSHTVPWYVCRQRECCQISSGGGRVWLRLGG